MSTAFRVVDAGLREGRYNIALDQAMLELHQRGAIGDSLRFIHFEPVALVGRHQELGREVDLEFCRRRGIAIGRRITGGGAIYLDPGQLGWELVFGRRTFGSATLADIARLLCEAAAGGLRRLGIDARYRPRNDIEVDGRKISGTGGFHDENTLIYQGTVLVDLDPELMLGALRVPRAKIAKRGLDSAAQRVVCLRELLGPNTPAIEAVQQALLRGFEDHLGVSFRTEPLTAVELALATELHESQIGRDEFVAEIDAPPGDAAIQSGEHTGPGGTISCYLRRDGADRGRIGHVLFTGDFFIAPPRLLLDLESVLRTVRAEAAVATVMSFFASHAVEALSVTPEDFGCALQAALGATSAAGATPHCSEA